MRSTPAVRHSISFASRLATAFVELTLATAVIIAAIVAGHELREWRDWYPTAYHPWVETPRAAPEAGEP